MKVLIVYYSLTGNTELIAQTIQSAITSEEKAMLSLKPLKDFAAGKFSTYLWGGMQAKMANTPELTPYDVDVSQYDLIFLGTPVWAWTLSPPIRSFVEKEAPKLKNIKIALFASSGGDGVKALARYESFMKNYSVIGSKRFIEPKSHRTEDQKQKAITWAQEMCQKLK